MSLRRVSGTNCSAGINVGSDRWSHKVTLCTSEDGPGCDDSASGGHDASSSNGISNRGGGDMCGDDCTRGGSTGFGFLNHWPATGSLSRSSPSEHVPEMNGEPKLFRQLIGSLGLRDNRLFAVIRCCDFGDSFRIVGALNVRIILLSTVFLGSSIGLQDNGGRRTQICSNSRRFASNFDKCCWSFLFNFETRRTFSAFK